MISRFLKFLKPKKISNNILYYTESEPPTLYSIQGNTIVAKHNINTVDDIDKILSTNTISKKSISILIDSQKVQRTFKSFPIIETHEKAIKSILLENVNHFTYTEEITCLTEIQFSVFSLKISEYLSKLISAFLQKGINLCSVYFVYPLIKSSIINSNTKKIVAFYYENQIRIIATNNSKITYNEFIENIHSSIEYRYGNIVHAINQGLENIASTKEQKDKIDIIILAKRNIAEKLYNDFPSNKKQIIDLDNDVRNANDVKDFFCLTLSNKMKKITQSQNPIMQDNIRMNYIQNFVISFGITIILVFAIIGGIIFINKEESIIKKQKHTSILSKLEKDYVKALRKIQKSSNLHEKEINVYLDIMEYIENEKADLNEVARLFHLINEEIKIIKIKWLTKNNKKILSVVIHYEITEKEKGIIEQKIASKISEIKDGFSENSLTIRRKESISVSDNNKIIIPLEIFLQVKSYAK